MIWRSRGFLVGRLPASETQTLVELDQVCNKFTLDWKAKRSYCQTTGKPHIVPLLINIWATPTQLPIGRFLFSRTNSFSDISFGNCQAYLLPEAYKLKISQFENSRTIYLWGDMIYKGNKTYHDCLHIACIIYFCACFCYFETPTTSARGCCCEYCWSDSHCLLFHCTACPRRWGLGKLFHFSKFFFFSPGLACGKNGWAYWLAWLPGRLFLRETAAA